VKLTIHFKECMELNLYSPTGLHGVVFKHGDNFTLRNIHTHISKMKVMDPEAFVSRLRTMTSLDKSEQNSYAHKQSFLVCHEV